MTKIFVKNENWLKHFSSEGFEDAGDFLTEVENKLGVFDIFTYRGKKYACCSSEPKVNQVLVEEITDEHKKDLFEEDEFFQEDKVWCPFCGSKNEDSWELSDSDDNYECGSCGSILSYERIVDVSYTTKLIKPTDVIEL